MVQDRADDCFAAEDIPKTIVNPVECDVVVLKRLGRFLTKYSSCLVHYRRQDVPAGSFNGHSDADAISR